MHIALMDLGSRTGEVERAARLLERVFQAEAREPIQQNERAWLHPGSDASLVTRIGTL